MVVMRMPLVWTGQLGAIDSQHHRHRTRREPGYHSGRQRSYQVLLRLA